MVKGMESKYLSTLWFQEHNLLKKIFTTSRVFIRTDSIWCSLSSFIWLHISAWFHSRAELSGNETAKQTAGCKTAKSMTLYNLQSFIFIPHIREKSKTCIRYPQTGIQTFDESHSGWRDWDTFSHQQRELLGKSTKLVQQGKGSATCYSIAPEYSDTDSKESKSN